MSKAKLRKELETLSQEQLVGIILRAYDARKEFKEYFEFFLNPDVDALNEKYQKAVDKEFSRTKWGYSKARVSKLKSLIKDYIGMDPGQEEVLKFMFYVVRSLVVYGTFYHYTDTQRNATVKILGDSATYAEKNEMFDFWLERFDALRHMNIQEKSFLHYVIRNLDIKQNVKYRI